MALRPAQTNAPRSDDFMSMRAIDSSVVMEKSGLIFSRALPLGTWELIGEQLLFIADSATWWIADWLVYGESAFHDRYQEAIKKTSLSYQTLRNYAWTARRFELSRRRDNLSFGHHAELTALDLPEQDFWLRKADEFGWSRNRLRSEVRASLRERQDGAALAPRSTVRAAGGDLADHRLGSPLLAASETLSLQLTPDQLTHCEAAASSRNLSLGEWAIQALDTAACWPL
jgi:hypothetical protein